MPLSLEEKNRLAGLLTGLMEKYSPPLVIVKKGNLGLDLLGNIPTLYGSKKIKIPGMYFASWAHRKDSVVFYFFPAYMNPASFRAMAPLSWKLLKGKTCFHLKKETDFHPEEIEAMFQAGIKYYQKQGWVG
jgi:hypothetical protein